MAGGRPDGGHNGRRAHVADRFLVEDASPDADDRERADLAFRLRDELDPIDDASVQLARGGAPRPERRPAIRSSGERSWSRPSRAGRCRRC